jgi:putative Holliday junction resolvase
MNQSADKTYIAIDYGTRRIGVAKSDPTGLIASALVTLEVTSENQAATEIVELLRRYRPKALVVGYPLLRSGDRSRKCDEIDRFIARVTDSYPVAVQKVDEQYTSQEAEDIVHAHGKRIGVDKKRVDRLAAVIILQRFLDESIA